LLRVNDVKVLNLTKGFRGSSSVLFRPAAQRKMKALKFAYRDRRQRKEISLWITRINAAARVYNLNYSQFIYKFKQLNIHIPKNG
jgi:large subunit ribosomal protein L20